MKEKYEMRIFLFGPNLYFWPVYGPQRWKNYFAELQIRHMENPKKAAQAFSGIPKIIKIRIVEGSRGEAHG